MDWLEKIPELLKMGWSDVAKVFIGVFMMSFMAVGWARTSRKRANALVEAAKAREDAAVEKARADIEAQKALLHAQLAEAERRHAADLIDQSRRHSENTADLNAKLQKAEKTRQQARSGREKYRKLAAERGVQIDELRGFDGKSWERPLLSTPPTFVPATERKTRFIAVANLKGGVGKTTVTANLGMSLARRGKRVLLVDLDFQGSLTRLCAPFTTLKQMFAKRETLSAAFDSVPHPPDVLDRIVFPVSSSPDGTPTLLGECSYIAAWDDLADVEFREEVRWLVSGASGPDIRFRFRRVFHASKVFDRFDYVFFDCPPRLTTACVNALACSDWLLIPVVPDQQSVQAIPRMLKMLKTLQTVSPARLLGIVMNEVREHGDGLTAAHQNILNQLPDFVRRSGYEMNGALRSYVKTDTIIANAANHGRIAAADDGGGPLFERLTKEFEKAAK